MRDFDIAQAILLPTVLVFGLTVSLTACKPHESSHNAHHANQAITPANQKTQAPAQARSTRHLYQIQNRQAKTNAELEEYVSRIGKKVVIVSDDPEANIHFKVTDDASTDYQVSPDGTIQVSTRLLKNLNDEAELAAILSHGIAKATQKSDQAEIEMMSNAGFDPKASMDLKARSNDPTQPWLKHIYANQPQQVDNSPTDPDQLPKGLRRGAEDYRKAIGIGS